MWSEATQASGRASTAILCWRSVKPKARLNHNHRLGKDFETAFASAKSWVDLASIQLIVRRLTRARHTRIRVEPDSEASNPQRLVSLVPAKNDLIVTHERPFLTQKPLETSGRNFDIYNTHLPKFPTLIHISVD